MAKKTPVQTQDDKKEKQFALGPANYKLLLMGFVIIVIGFVLMVGGGSDDPNVFNLKMFSFRRITLAPILVLLGLGFEIYAIMKRPKKEE